MDAQRSRPANEIHSDPASAVDQFIQLTRTLVGVEPWIPRTYAQASALNSNAEILLFGGAAGGLKTATLLMDAVAEVANANLRAVIIRQTKPQLENIREKARELYSGYPYFGRYIKSKDIWIFPRNLLQIWEYLRSIGHVGHAPVPDYNGGATIRLSFIASNEDCYAHDGQEYSFIGIDESTHHPEFQVRYLLARLRSTDQSLNCRLRLTCNPGNVGHAWHMQLFIGKECWHCHPNSDRVRKPFVIYGDARFPDGDPVRHTTQFIPGRVQDHSLFSKPTDLKQANDRYIQRLKSLNGDKAKMLLDGCWNVFEGQYFDNWNPARSGMPMVVSRRSVGEQWWWPRWVSADYGFTISSPAAHLFVRSPALEGFPRGRIYVLAEYGDTRETAAQFAQSLITRWVLDQDGRQIEYRWHNWYLDPNIWAERGKAGGTSFNLGAQMNDVLEPYDLQFTPARNDRAGGAVRLYTLLENGELVICDNCPKTIESRLESRTRSMRTTS